jgi:hypothetical protein
MMLAMVLSSLVVVGLLLVLPLFYDVIGVVAGYNVILDEKKPVLPALL